MVLTNIFVNKMNKMENSFKKTEVSKRRKWNNVHKQTVFTPLNIFACWNLKT